MSTPTSPHDISRRSSISGTIEVAGRLRRLDGGARIALEDAHGSVPLEAAGGEVTGVPDGSLVRLDGRWNGTEFGVETLEVVQEPNRPGATAGFTDRDGMMSVGQASQVRADACEAIRDYFEAEDFLEVDTPHAVESPGTDIYLQPVGTRSVVDAGTRAAPPWLHTSPEFAMKRLLCEGFTRIWQQCKVWRDGEVTDRHNPEFTMLEWYRAWEGPDAVMADVEEIVRAVCGDEATVVEETPDGRHERVVDLQAPFERITMRELVDRTCGFDLLEALDYGSLRRACAAHGLLERSLQRRYPPATDKAAEEDGKSGRWDELFFELMVTELEPALGEMGAVFVTEWPAPLAVLARKKPDDPRVAERFELFVGGMELANGFAELTDPVEQRERFEHDLAERQKLGLPELPMPETFLEALEAGLPPSTGVALGFDRLLMARTGAATLRAVTPFAQSPSPPG